MSDIALSVIVPMYNEQDVIRNTIDDLKSRLAVFCRDFEVIIVDDGSQDKSVESVKDKLCKNIVLIKNETNMGIGASFKNGLAHARHEYVTWFPSDGEFPADQLISLLQDASPKRAVVSVPSNSKIVRSRFRYFLSKSFRHFVSIFFHMNLSYYNGMAIYPSKMVKSIKIYSHGFTFPLEVLYRLSKMGIEFKEVGVTLKPREAGESKAIRVTVLINIIFSLLRIRFF